MARITIITDSLSDNETLRKALVVHNKAVRQGVPVSEAAREGEGRAFVRVEGPEAWNVRSAPLHPHQAARMAATIAGFGVNPVITSTRTVMEAMIALRNGTDQARAEAADALEVLLHNAELPSNPVDTEES